MTAKQIFLKLPRLLNPLVLLVIRLARIGRENLPKFRLIAQEKTASPKSGKVFVNLGSYNPKHAQNQLIFDKEKIMQLVKNGAVPSNTVARLLIKNGIDKVLLEKFLVKYAKQKSKSAQAEETKKASAAAPANPQSAN